MTVSTLTVMYGNEIFASGKNSVAINCCSCCPKGSPNPYRKELD